MYQTERKYIVAYDLNAPGQKYKKMTEALETYGTNQKKILETTWLLKTRKSAQEIYDGLKAYLDSNDRIIVIEVVPANAQGWLSQDAWNWLKS